MGSVGVNNIPSTTYTNPTNFKSALSEYFTINNSTRRGEYKISENGIDLGVIRFGKDLGNSVVKISNGTDSNGVESWTSYNNLKSVVDTLRRRR